MGIWQSSRPRRTRGSLAPRAWALLATLVFTGFVFLGFASWGWASPPASESPAVPELKIDLRTDRGIYAEELRTRGAPDALAAPAAADAQCVARYGAGHFAAAIVGAEFLCVHPAKVQIGALNQLCAARFPNSEFAMLLGPELILYCRSKGKAI